MRRYLIVLMLGFVLFNFSRLPVFSSDYVATGVIQIYAGATAPSGWLLCDGSAIGTNSYPALFAVIGSTYGGAGTNFNVPDMRGRSPMGMGSGSGLTARSLNDSGGSETVTLASNNIPSHTHSASPGSVNSGYESAPHTHQYPWFNSSGSSKRLGAGTGLDQTTALWGNNPVGHTHTVSITPFSSASTGGGATFTNLSPYIVLNFIIKN